MIRGGRLNNYVLLQKSVTSQDSVYGGSIETWQDVKRLWCGIKVKSGQEDIVNGKLSEKLTIEITVRLDSAFVRNSSYRIIDNSDIYLVKGWFIPEFDNSHLVLIASLE